MSGSTRWLMWDYTRQPCQGLSGFTIHGYCCHPQRHKYTKTTIQTQSTEIQTYKYTNTQGSLAKVHHTGLLEAQILKAAEILNNKLILCAVTSQHTRQINILEWMLFVQLHTGRYCRLPPTASGLNVEDNMPMTSRHAFPVEWFAHFASFRCSKNHIGGGDG